MALYIDATTGNRTLTAEQYKATFNKFHAIDRARLNKAVDAIERGPSTNLAPGMDVQNASIELLEACRQELVTAAEEQMAKGSFDVDIQEKVKRNFRVLDLIEKANAENKTLPWVQGMVTEFGKQSGDFFKFLLPNTRLKLGLLMSSVATIGALLIAFGPLAVGAALATAGGAVAMAASTAVGLVVGALLLSNPVGWIILGAIIAIAALAILAFCITKLMDWVNGMSKAANAPADAAKHAAGKDVIGRASKIAGEDLITAKKDLEAAEKGLTDKTKEYEEKARAIEGYTKYAYYNQIPAIDRKISSIQNELDTTLLTDNRLETRQKDLEAKGTKILPAEQAELNVCKQQRQVLAVQGSSQRAQIDTLQRQKTEIVKGITNKEKALGGVKIEYDAALARRDKATVRVAAAENSSKIAAMSLSPASKTSRHEAFPDLPKPKSATSGSTSPVSTNAPGSNTGKR